MPHPLSHPFYHTLLTRRSIRKYEDRPVPREVIERLLTASIWAPNAHNRQPWRFVVVLEPAQKAALARRLGERFRADLQKDGLPVDEIERRVRRSYERFTTAPALIIGCLSMEDMDIYPDERRQRLEWVMATQSLALALGNLLLAAHHEGLGACWICAPLFAPDAVNAALNLPAHWQPQALITLGYPAETRTQTRKPLEEVVAWR